MAGSKPKCGEALPVQSCSAYVAFIVGLIGPEYDMQMI